MEHQYYSPWSVFLRCRSSGGVRSVAPPWGRPYFTQAAAWAQAKMKWPRQPQMTTLSTQAGHRR